MDLLVYRKLPHSRRNKFLELAKVLEARKLELYEKLGVSAMFFTT